MGNFVECSFFDNPLIEFLSSVYLHDSGEEINDISKTKIERMLPFLCGISSRDKKGEQKIVHKFNEQVGTNHSDQDPEFYVRYLTEQWLETPLPFLHCIYEARMKKIQLRPPQNENQIFIVQAKLTINDLVALSHYLDNFDKSRVHLDAIIIKDCGLNDASLSVLGSKVSNHVTDNDHHLRY